MRREILTVKNVSKNYILERNGTNSDVVFRALSDISFDLHQGEILGVVGRNGAGKSTLLKILSGITKPSNGSVCIYGRTASVLDNGLGFHEEFTGRENIYVSARLMGLSKKEVNNSVEKIIEFSGIKEFIDVPLKKYSTGMQTRLSTAIALHTNPDILLIDEQILSGDFAFRQSVFDFIQSKISSGISAVMVSHSPNDLINICSTCLMLEKGNLIEYGTIGSILKKYIGQSLLEGIKNNEKGNIQNQSSINIEWKGDESAPGTSKIRLRHIRVNSIEGNELISMDDDFKIKIVFEKADSNYSVQLHVVFYDIFKNVLFSTDVFSNREEENLHSKFFDSKGLMCYEVIIPKHFFYKGEYSIQLRFGTNIETEEFVFMVPVRFCIFESRKQKDYITDSLPIYIRPKFTWKYYISDVSYAEK
ncbi:MAG: ABC transporter ATP-binding protein [Bacteroidota bacterium]